MRKISFKKIAALLFSAAGLTTLSAGAAGCLPKSSGLQEPDNIEIDRLTPPDDGSLPTAHTCAENLAYIISVFDSQPQYHTYSYGVTSASITTQTTRNFRDYKDGILLNTDLTHSSMVKSGTQTCSMYNAEGEYEVYLRTSEAPEANTLPAQAVWHDDAPTVFNKKSYNYTYGLLPNELFNYIVNEQNIISSEQVKVNADGTYTQNFTLDPVASTYYYQFGMKTRGGLSGYPEFSSITFSVTFDEKWQILSSTMHEVAKVNKGIVVDSISDFSTEYWYGDDHFDEEHFAFYESYFKNYLGDDRLEQGGATDETLVVDVTNVLSNGFSQIMNGGAQFEITADIGANRYTGYLFVSLDLADPLGTLALKVSLGKSLRQQTFYLEYLNGEMAAYYGKDFALSANIAEVKLAAEKFGEIIDGIKAAFTPTAQGETVAPAAQADGDPLTALMNSMTLVAGEKQAVLTLDTDDLLGLGVGINARLVFGINNNQIAFRGGTVSDLSLGGEGLDIGLTIVTTTAPEINREATDAGADLADYVADVYALLGSDLLKIDLTLDGSGEKVSVNALKNMKAEVTAYADIDGVTVGAEANVSYTYLGKTLSAKAFVRYGYDPAEAGYGKAVVGLTEFNGAPVDLKVKCDIKELADAVSTLVTFSGGEGDGGATEGLVSLINNALSSDLSGLLSETYADKSQIKVGVSVDSVLGALGIDAGVKFGSCTLKYVRGGGVYGGELSASLPALGFDLTVSGAEGAIEQPSTDDCLDLVYLIEDVKEIATADLLKAHISLDGSADGVTVSQLGGLKADIDVYFNLKNIAVAAEVDLGYTYGEDKISAKLSAWYEDGKVVLSLNAINGAPLAAKVYCDINEMAEAVTALLQYADVKLTPFENSGVQTADILTKILGADFNALLPVLKTGSDGLNIAVNVEEVLNLFGVNINLDFGNVTLAYSHFAENKLVAAVPALGLSVDVSGAAGQLSAMPDAADCLDLTKLVTTVQAVWEQVDGIIDGQSITFEIIKGDTFLSLDGIKAEIWGEGEICWKQGSEYVALDLAMAISETGTDVTEFKLIYDKNAENTPLVRLALNEVGIDIYKEDIDGVISGFNDIYNKVMAALGGNGGVSEVSEPGGSGESDGNALNTDNLLGVLFGVLSSDNWVNFLNDFTVTTDGKSVALKYLADNAASVELRADGCLALYYDGAFGDGFTLGGGITATAVGGSLIPSIESKLKTLNMTSSKTEGSAAFVKLAYDFLFEAISNISVENILGSKTYTVNFELNGKNCNIPELENVFIDAQIYISGETADEGKLAEGCLNIDAAGVVVKLHVISERRGNNTRFYINLSQIADVKLPDLKFLATQESLYRTFEVLVATINDTNLLDVMGKLMGGETQTTPAPDANGGTESAPVISQEQADKIADILSRLLNFNFNDAVVATEVDGVITANIDLDNIVKQFGIQTGKLGTVEAVINRNDHSMKTSGKTAVAGADGSVTMKEWIWLSSEITERRSYEGFNRNDYISIEFLPTLIDDLVKTLTDENGNMHDKFTLAGTIDVNIVSLITVKLEITTLTVNLNGENGLYLSLIANLSGGMVSNGTIGLTYQNGYLTLGRKLSTATPEYRVMTFEYFLDNMFAKGSNSTINWLLGVSDMIWNMMRGQIGDLANIDSGLTTPEQIYLYKPTVNKTEQEISMYDFVKALRVVTDGRQSAAFGDYSALEKDLGVSDNYYGFALDAGKITGGVLTKLNAAITRGGNGLDRVLANGAIQSYVTFGADLQFKEDWSEDYVIGTANNGGKTAPSLYDLALAEAEKAGKLPDFDHYVKKTEEGYDEKFGCFSVTGGSGGFTFSTEYSHMLYSHVLTVVGLNGEIEERNVRHGSTIYLYDNSSPLYTDGSLAYRVLYSTSQGSVGASSVEMNGDLTVYALTRKAVNVIVHSGSEEFTVTTFVGDRVPTSVAGLESVSRPSYDEEGTKLVGDNDIINENQTVIHIYGTFVNSEVVINDVKYTFNADTLSYTASGKAAGFNDNYSVKGNVLVLENEIGGYPVTAIADGAFANTDGKPIKSVIIPSNVTSVGSGAFLDNTGMERVVILGDYVKMGGNASKDNNSDNDQPFYGCSAEAGGTSTNLVIYYNTVECGGSTTNTIWTKFRVSGTAIKNRYYIGQKPSNENGYAKNGGGALYGAGSWCMLDTEVSGGEIVGELDFNALVNANVTGGFKTEIYTKAQADALAATLTSALSQYKNAAGGDKYVVNVSLTATSVSQLKLTVKVLLNVPVQIDVYSPVAMTYGETAVEGGTQASVYATAVGGGVALIAPVATDGSAFLGWAVEKDGALQFVGEQAEAESGTVFYAVWGKSKVGQEVRASVNYSGSVLANPTSGNGKWHDNEWNEVTEISKDNLIVYTRAVFTFEYKLSGNFNMKVSDTLNNVSEKTTKSYSASFEVLEAQNVSAVKEGGKTVNIYVDGNLKTTLTLTKYLAYNYNFKDVSYGETVSGNLSLELKW